MSTATTRADIARWTDAIALFVAAQHAAGYEPLTVHRRELHLRYFARRVACGPWTLSWEVYRRCLDGFAVSESTRLAYRATLRAFYRWAVKTGRLDDDPTAEPSLRAEQLAASPAWETELTAYKRHMRAIGRAEGTVRVRISQLRRFARERSTMAPYDVDLDDLLEWMGGQRWEPETRHAHAAAFRSFYGWARMTKRTKKNPAAKIPAVRMGQHLARPARGSDYTEARAKANRWERLALQLAAELGLRCAEVSAVHARDIDGSAGSYWLTVKGKGNKQRRVPLSDDLAGAIRARGGGYAFPGQWDGHLSPEYMSKRINRLLPEGVTMHMLRHRFATTAYNVDRDVFTVQRLLGHSSPAVTQRYVAVGDENMRRLVTTVRNITDGRAG